jgi:hypothetical protein
VDEQPLAGAQPGLGEDGVVGGREDLGRAARLGPAERVGHADRLALVDGRELGLPAAADDRHDAVALGEARRARAEADDLTGELEAGDVGRGARRRGVHPAPLHHVRAVDPGAPDADEDLAAAGLGIRVVLDAQLLVADRDGAHGAAVKHARATGAGPPARP